MTMHAGSKISAEQIVLRREGRCILDGVTVSLVPGRLLAIIGPNGAGKSSLVSVLSGLWRPDGGRVTLDGRDLHDYRAAERARRCAVMRQDNLRPPGMTVLEAVELGCLARAAGDDAERIARDMLRRMELDDLAARDCGRLSGGEWQRVAFARTMAQICDGENRGVFLLDEPVSSLDPPHQHQLLALARELARAGHAVLAVLHDLNLTSLYADEVVLLEAGRIRAAGPAAEIMQPALLSEVYGCRVVALSGAREAVRALVSLPAGGRP